MNIAQVGIGFRKAVRISPTAAICMAAVFSIRCPALAGGWADRTISINFSGSCDKANAPTDDDFSGVSGTALYGALPVAGDNWNNFQTHYSGYGSSVSRSQSIKLGDGTVAQGVSAAWDTGVTYTINKSARHDSIFHSFLDGNVNQKLTLSGLTAENGFPSTCTVYIYCGSDRGTYNAVFEPKTVNGKTYTFSTETRAVEEGTTSWGGYAFAQGNELVLGGDYLKITNVQVSAEGTIEIAYAKASDSDGKPKYHGTLSAVQIDFSERRDYALSVNFSGGRRVCDKDYGALSGTAEYGAVPVAGNLWFNSHVEAVDDKSGIAWSDGAVHPGDVLVSHDCNGTWTVNSSTKTDNLFHAYMDDTPAKVTIKGLTAENGFPGYCWLYVYLSCDVNIGFNPVSVNGTAYSYYAQGAVAKGSGVWGWSSHAKDNNLLLGGDYLRIGPVTIPNDGVIHVSTPRAASNARGGIAAVQVAVPVPETFTVTATGEDGKGTVSVNGGADGVAASVGGTFGTPVECTMRAVPAEGFGFVRWEGATGLITSGSRTTAEIMVKSDMPAELRAVFAADGDVWTATWTGGGQAPGDMADPANWSCADRNGNPVSGVPTSITAVCVAGTTAFACPAGTSLDCASILFDGVRLASDADWTGLDLAKVAVGSSIDLGGNDLELSGFAGAVDAGWTVTDSSAQGAGGSLTVTVPAGAELSNRGVALTGTLKFVKDGAGSFIAAKAGQTYTGGTHVKGGTAKFGTGTQPFGPNNATQTVRIESGATFDTRYFHANCYYNYELGGTLTVRGYKEGDSWDKNKRWTSRIDLIGDATICGGYFYFGSSNDSAPNTLNLNGHTLDLYLPTGAIYVKGLATDDTDGTIRITSGSAQLSGVDWRTANFRCTSGYTFFGGSEVPVKDFSYAIRHWRSHRGTCQFRIYGTYLAGPNRPALTLQGGATLDLSSMTTALNVDGQSATITANNSDFSTTGQVLFESGKTINVVFGARAGMDALAKSKDEEGRYNGYVATWGNAKPINVKFALDAAYSGKYVLVSNDTGLLLRPKVGLSIVVR